MSSSEAPSLAVVRAVASVKECSVLDLNPIARSIDPDALDTVIREGTRTTCTFHFEEYVIHVDSWRVSVTRLWDEVGHSTT